MENLGVLFADTLLSLAAVAHLYNVAKQTKRLKGKWTALEIMIEINKSKLFLGDLPDSPTEFSTRLSICAGTSSSVFARNVRTTTLRKSKELKKVNPKKIFHQQSVSLLLAEYLDRKCSAEKVLFEANQDYRTRRLTPKRGWTQIEMMLGLQNAMEDTLPKQRIDYISLTKASTKLIDLIREKLKDRIIFTVEDGNGGNNSYSTVKNTLEDANDKALNGSREDRKGAHDVTKFGGKYLEIAVKVIEAFIKDVEVEGMTVEPFSEEVVTSFLGWTGTNN